MKITFIEKVDHNISSRFAYAHHKLKQAGHEVDQRFPEGELPDQTDVLIVAGQDFSEPQPEFANTYPILLACNKVQAGLRLVLADNVADGVLGPEWLHMKTPLDINELLRVINARLSAAVAEVTAK